MTSKLKDNFKNERIAMTMGDAGENHVGMELLGNFGEKGSGFTTTELKTVKRYFKKYYKHKGITPEYKSFTLEKDNQKHKAGVLILRNYLNEEKQRQIYDELKDLNWDKQFYDTRRNKVLNKQARYNLMFIEGLSQQADYINKKGTIIDINKLTNFKKFKSKISNKINNILGNEKASNLIAEGNRYFDVKMCGIGLHGDTERRKVICLSLGQDNYPMQWVWFHKSKPISDPFKVELNSGDVYIMTETAVGTDWKCSSLITMRHAAGSKKYLSLDKYNEENIKKKEEKKKEQLEKLHKSRSENK